MAGGNIDSLNFEVILNDKKFEATVRKDLELARNLNTSLTQVLNLKNSINANASSAYLTEQKLAQASAKTSQAKAREALEWQKVRTEAEKTALANQKVKASIENSASSFTGGGNSLLRVWLRFYATVWSVISSVRIFVRTFGAAIKKISEFQQANANLATIMQVSRREVKTLTEDALMLGRTTEWTASQVTELQTALAKLGYNIPQIRNMQASVLQFATAVGAKLPDAANLAGASLRMFGMHSTEMQKALEVLTASTNKTALDFEKLKVSLPYVGAIAHSIGMDIAETSSLLGVLTNAGLQSSRAGTGLRKVLLELSKDNGKLQTAMGGNIKTFDDFVNGLQALRDRGLEAGEAQKLVGDRAGAALIILANGVDDIRRLNKEVRETDGLLKDIQSERLNTLHGSTLLLKSAWEGLIQTFRDSAGPMKDVVDWLTKIVRATSLAASRANRVAQGTKDVIGSDDLIKQFKQQYDSLIRSGNTPDVAATIVQDAMNSWLQGAYGELSSLKKKGYKETPLNNILYEMPLAHFFMGNMRKGRAANEQVEAIENAIDSVNDYMANSAKEEGEIAANNYLEEWKMVFDTQGEAAAREAMKKVTGYEDMKSRMEAYIANGGESGAYDRGKAKNGKSADAERRDAISDIQSSIALLEKFKSAYEKLEPILGGDAARAWVFNRMGFDVAKLDGEFEKLIASLRLLGSEGMEAADMAEARLGLDEASKMVKTAQAADKAQKALDKYNTTLRKWMGEDFNLGGTGFEYDINKIFSDLNTKLSAVDEKYISAVKEAEEAHKGDADAIAEETKKLEALRDAEKEYVRAKAQESMNGLAESYLKDQYLLRGVSLENLSGKTIGQLRRLKQELVDIGQEALRMNYDFSGLEGFLSSLGMDIENLTDEDIDSLKDKLPESTIEMVKLMKAVKDTGLSFDVLTEKIQSAIEKGLVNLDDEEKKSIAKLAKFAANQVVGLADSFRELGEAMGNSGMSQAAEDISDIADVAKDIAAGFQQGGVYGAIIGGVVSFIKKIVEAQTEVEKFRSKLASLKEEIRNSDALDALSSSSEGIFGDNSLKRMREAISLLEEAKDALGRIRPDGQGILLGKPTIFQKDWWKNAMASANGEWNYYGYKFGDAVAAAEKNGLDAYDENGMLNRKSLEALKELYPEYEQYFDELINRVNEYYQALEAIDEVAESIVGNVVSNVADKIVDSWWEAGRAALDYADILEDVAKGYAKLIVQNMLMDAAFDDDKQKKFKDALKNGDAVTAMSVVQQAMDSAVNMLPVVEQALQAFEPYRNMSGEDSGSMGSGIKNSITEETGSLLASYINAIRADVSYLRALQEKGWSDIATIGASIPTLNDYLNQVAANTYDTAQNTQRILSELQSVIGAPGTSGSVVRVERMN